MEQNETTAIVKRFFEALETLKESGLLGGLQTFTRRYGLDRRNVQHLRGNLESGTFKAGWLTYLVNDFHVSATWLTHGARVFLAVRLGRGKGQKVQFAGNSKQIRRTKH